MLEQSLKEIACKLEITNAYRTEYKIFIFTSLFRAAMDSMPLKLIFPVRGLNGIQNKNGRRSLEEGMLSRLSLFHL